MTDRQWEQCKEFMGNLQSLQAAYRGQCFHNKHPQTANKMNTRNECEGLNVEY